MQTERHLAAKVALLMGFAIPFAAQTPTTVPVEDSRFEVVSIKPLPPGSTLDSGGYRSTPTRFSGRFSVKLLARIAYQVAPDRVVDGPAWAVTEGFEIEATNVEPRQRGALPFMLQHLLEERFHLKVRREQRPMPAFALIFSRSDRRLGPQLRRVSRDCITPAPGSECGMVPLESSYRGVGQQWNEFVGMLSNFVGRSIVDKTGLSGQFDVNLEWTAPDSNPVPQIIDSGPARADVKAPPSLRVAVDEQLGLKLEPTTEPAQVLVIDSVERPTPN